jgi:polysaccharide pyruvyl transferase WcaK-like protein
MTKQRAGSMRWVVESTSDNIGPSDEFIAEAITTALTRRMRRANLAIAFFDEHDVRRGTVTIEKLGTPISPEMQRQMEFEFGMEEEDPAVTA